MTGPNETSTAKQLSALMGGAEVLQLNTVQDLWSGYGAIYRVSLAGDTPTQVVVKCVAPPNQMNHPRGWNSDLSHQRKLRSYEVERAWYLTYAPRCRETCRVPELLAEECADGRWLFVFEDLDHAGFPARRHHASPDEIRACLSWLASFHATFLGENPNGLWPIGTYWHLATRPEELNAIADQRLREAAPLIDTRLNSCTYQTLVHGDAKVANFCFPPRGGPVAAVDFQYVGGGCGMKDVAYFLSSCLAPSDLNRQAAAFVDWYFDELRVCLAARLDPQEIDALEAEWRSLYRFAWADFYRFLAGWSPQHWKIDQYSRRLTNEVLAELCSE
jgi:hypothetical protein